MFCRLIYRGEVMTLDYLMELFSKYGIFIIFIIILLEYLNCPGLAAGIIMPGVGILAKQVGVNLLLLLGVSILAGVLSSIILYYISYFIGKPIVDYIYKKFPKSRKSIDKSMNIIEKYGNKGFLISRLMPVVRTLVPIPAGIFKVDIKAYIIYSAIGIAIWNSVLIGIGYIFGFVF